MLRRDQGKIVFGVLQDSTERIQLFASEKSSPDFELFSNLHLGDWLGVTGEVIKTSLALLLRKNNNLVVLLFYFRECNSIGRAPAFQAGSCGFESHHSLSFNLSSNYL